MPLTTVKPACLAASVSFKSQQTKGRSQTTGSRNRRSLRRRGATVVESSRCRYNTKDIRFHQGSQAAARCGRSEPVDGKARLSGSRNLRAVLKPYFSRGVPIYALGIKNLLDPQLEEAGDLERQRKAGVILAGLDGVDRLPRDL